MSTYSLLVTGTLVLADRILPAGAVLIKDQHVAWVGLEKDLPSNEAQQVIAHDGLVFPGLVDIHCHGGGGVSFPDSTDFASASIAINEHRKHGTTSLMASMVTAAPQTLREKMALVADLVNQDELIGVHLEGPFISPARCGAQNPAQIQEPNPQLVTDLCTEFPGVMKTMTIAPEREGALETIAELSRHGVVASLGHTDCNGVEMEAGIAATLAGLRASETKAVRPTATHLFNGMRPIHHRNAGPAFACMDAAAKGEMCVELIGDGVHTETDTIRYLFSVVGGDNIALITDAMAAAGMPDGDYELGSLAVIVKDGIATLADGSSIAGGTAHLLDVVRVCVQKAGVDLLQAVRSASIVPARAVAIDDQVGSIANGKFADLVLVDADLRPQQVIRRGLPV